ncbi:hypothetical protein MM26B8_00850 [Mycoplasmopsis meleagridis]|uniref:Uncharacterized protein n=1 Tax=Mycoplasmopsis meleagridis ATCC 25294 TaxID=1264554 RepID=A0A0F5H0E3_9BACT|nr:hypothetical protein [Mycoplasmopsis meleagridis]KKB26595.1 hypothetical protein MMELEA_02020 [Mycoplasmopsis meleagridis ATCC 25294]OAD18465.1 hypothetical protein MM26B8_00850 [Mycoplasmopsis meleagridis]VEU77666.1 Uncharacterised protein [Mycoplasmopsis meleagridis]
MEQEEVKNSFYYSRDLINKKVKLKLINNAIYLHDYSNKTDFLNAISNFCSEFFNFFKKKFSNENYSFLITSGQNKIEDKTFSNFISLFANYFNVYIYKQGEVGNFYTNKLPFEIDFYVNKTIQKETNKINILLRLKINIKEKFIKLLTNNINHETIIEFIDSYNNNLVNDIFSSAKNRNEQLKNVKIVDNVFFKRFLEETNRVFWKSNTTFAANLEQYFNLLNVKLIDKTTNQFVFELFKNPFKRENKNNFFAVNWTYNKYIKHNENDLIIKVDKYYKYSLYLKIDNRFFKVSFNKLKYLYIDYFLNSYKDLNLDLKNKNIVISNSDIINFVSLEKEFISPSLFEKNRKLFLQNYCVNLNEEIKSKSLVIFDKKHYFSDIFNKLDIEEKIGNNYYFLLLIIKMLSFYKDNNNMLSYKINYLNERMYKFYRKTYKVKILEKQLNQFCLLVHQFLDSKITENKNLEFISIDKKNLISEKSYELTYSSGNCNNCLLTHKNEGHFLYLFVLKTNKQNNILISYDLLSEELIFDIYINKTSNDSLISKLKDFRYMKFLINELIKLSNSKYFQNNK